jgi:hypothetical protein
MSKLLELQRLADEATEASGIDMNEAVAGGGGRLLPEGYAFGQLVEYIEYGQQPQEFAGKAKPPTLEMTLGFALSGQGYSNDDGTPYVVRTYNTAVHRNEKAGAYKMFKALNWKGTAKSFAQLIGQFFLVKIVHKQKSKTDTKLVSRIDTNGFLPPLDPVTRQPYAIPGAPDALFRMFLWDRPTLAAWDSLRIEGTYDDGKSKNRLQETILAAVDYEGSPLQSLLAGPKAALPDPSTLGVVAPLAVPQVPAPVVSVAAPVAVAAPALPIAPVPVAVAPVQVPAGPVPIAIPAVSLPAVPSSPVLPV